MVRQNIIAVKYLPQAPHLLVCAWGQAETETDINMTLFATLPTFSFPSFYTMLTTSQWIIGFLIQSESLSYFFKNLWKHLHGHTLAYVLMH